VFLKFFGRKREQLKFADNYADVADKPFLRGILIRHAEEMRKTKKEIGKLIPGFEIPEDGQDNTLESKALRAANILVIGRTTGAMGDLGKLFITDDEAGIKDAAVGQCFAMFLWTYTAAYLEEEGIKIDYDKYFITHPTIFYLVSDDTKAEISHLAIRMYHQLINATQPWVVELRRILLSFVKLYAKTEWPNKNKEEVDRELAKVFINLMDKLYNAFDCSAKPEPNHRS